MNTLHLGVALLGAHISAAGGLHKAFERGRAIGCDALQIFVKNANRWQAKPLDDEAVTTFRQAHEHHPLPVIAHASYLINLCSSNPETAKKSRAALIDELLRCTALGVEGLVLHPGAHLGQGVQEGLESVARALNDLFNEHPEIKTTLLLENTAGQGTVLGSDFEELATLLALTDERERLGICFDSCHAFAAGYDLRGAAGYEQVLETFESAVGLVHLKVFHLNDSKFALGQNKDRHANVGQGEIGEAFFERVVNDETFTDTPMLLETPLGEDGAGHARDLQTLRALQTKTGASTLTR